MKLFFSSFFFILISSTLGYTQDSALRLIPFEEVLERKLDGSFHYVYATFTNMESEPISDYERQQLNLGKMAMKYYEDETQVIKEVRIRPHTLDDKFEQAVLTVRPYLLEQEEIVEVNCDKTASTYEALIQESEEINDFRDNLSADLDFRERWTATQNYMDSIQHDARKFAILHHCEWDEDQIDNILTLINAEGRLATFHYLKLKDLYEQEKIDPSDWAALQDLILIHNNFDQIYGTNIRNGHLAKIESPYNVNTRRLEMGLPPIEQTLEKYGLDYDIEVHRMTRYE